MRRRILLVQPPFYRLHKDTYSLDRYPLALGYLGGAIRQHTDWQVMAYNTDFSMKSETIEFAYMLGPGFANYLQQLRHATGGVWEEVRATIAEYRPNVVGISAKSQDFASARIVAKIAKQIDPRTTVVVGGPHASMVGTEVLRHPEIDLCVRGEGEVTLVELLQCLAQGSDLDQVAGVAFRRDGRIVENAPRAMIADLDSLPIPHEHAAEILKDYSRYPSAAFEHVFAIRGCPLACTFCGSRYLWSRRPRFRSPAHVVREIQGLRRRGLNVFDFEDDTFGVNRKYIRQLCRAMIEHCPGIKWNSELHVRLVDDGVLSLMKAAGCYSVQLGIESGSNQILREIRKNITIEEALAACRTVKRHGLDLHLFFMVGFPQETEETLQATVRAIQEAPCDSVVYSVFTPYPGTEMFQFCRDKGLIGDDFDVSLYNHQSAANSFCLNIPPERLHWHTAQIARLVDRKNRRGRLRRLFSANTMWRIREAGLREAFRKAVRVVRGK